MKIPPDELESTKDSLRRLIDERTSAPWAEYDDDELSQDNQDYEDIDGIETVFDVLMFLRDQGGRTVLTEYNSCLDPLGKFEPSNGEYVDESDEVAFREYLSKTYGIDPKEFPSMR